MHIEIQPIVRPNGIVPTGHTRRHSGDYAGAAAARTFGGLPPAFSHPKQLLEPLRAAGRRLPFPRVCLDLLAVLLDHSDPADWRAAGRPVVFPGNGELAGLLGVSVTTVKRQLGLLRSAGAVIDRRGPGNRRTPTRDSRGGIVDLFGIDLSPLLDLALRMGPVAVSMRERRRAVRAAVAEIVTALQAVREHADAVAVALLDLEAGISALPTSRQDLVQALVTLQSLRGEAESVRSAAYRIRATDPHTDEDGQEQHDVMLADLRETSNALAERAFEIADAVFTLSVESSSKRVCHPTAESPLKTTSESKTEYWTPIQGQDSDFRHSQTSTGSNAINDPSPQTHDLPSNEELLIRPSGLIALSPRLAETLTDMLLVSAPDQASPAEIADAAKIMATRHGLAGWAWAQGVERHGRWRAALAVIVADAWPTHEVRRSRGAMLAGMLRKDRGQLNPLPSLYALRRRLGQERRS